MIKLLKNSLESYKRECILSSIFLFLIFQYILNFAQEDIGFAGILDTWGMWCRIFCSMTNVFWFGASYWILFFVWLREIYVRNISLMVTSRTCRKCIWSGRLLKKGVILAFIYPVMHFVILCVVNVYLYGWNLLSWEEKSFKKLFLNMDISEAVVETFILKILISVLITIMTWIVFLVVHNITAAVVSSLIFCLISVILVSLNSVGFFVFFPAGISFYYLLVGGRKVILILVIVLGICCCAVFFIQRYLIHKIEMQKFWG